MTRLTGVVDGKPAVRVPASAPARPGSGRTGAAAGIWYAPSPSTSSTAIRRTPSSWSREPEDVGRPGHPEHGAARWAARRPGCRVAVRGRGPSGDSAGRPAAASGHGRRANRCSWAAMSRNGGRARQRQFQVQQRLRVRLDHRRGQQVGEHPYPVDLLDREPGGGEQRGGALGVVAPAQGVPRPGPAVRVGEQRGRRVEVAVDGPAQHGGRPAGDQDAGRAAGPQRGGDRGDHPGRVVDDLEHGVAQDQVDAARLDQAGERVAVALHGVHPVGDPGVGGPAGQRGERVGAGVDHGDPVPGLGERHGEPAGAAADVEHGQLPAGVPLAAPGAGPSQTAAVRAVTCGRAASVCVSTRAA